MEVLGPLALEMEWLHVAPIPRLRRRSNLAAASLFNPDVANDYLQLTILAFPEPEPKSFSLFVPSGGLFLPKRSARQIMVNWQLKYLGYDEIHCHQKPSPSKRRCLRT